MRSVLSKTLATAQENNYDSLLKRIKAKELSPVYLLQGDEPFFIDGIAKCLEENVLAEAEKSFNQTILYGNHTFRQLFLRFQFDFLIYHEYFYL